MLTLDSVGRWITRRTGRSLDQHATDSIPAAAHLPQAASRLRRARTELLLTVDRLRTALINEDDLTGATAAVTGPLAAVEKLGREYRYARNWADMLIGDQARTEYADANNGQALRRRYVNPGDRVLVVLPHTDSCRLRQLAGPATRVRVGRTDAELDLMVGSGQLRLAHADAGIYRDPAHGLYVLAPAADESAASGD
ncbi:MULTISPECIES: hypothetical protein [Micromonospora]|uniref:Uncharacterized protein n=1 Tax=Micromonospora sicca TaxID=2202420 RepID=A0A317DIC7_9ACTN|nr:MULTISPECIES: hypothetical protein [unclassified Micromonospora]MBM0224523.1 hypothetical protein [Micromonospora sp. ATA51]PWR14391.1 hypothetical protein DKT69_16505 [Micromonospora sp. 4G51]